MVTELVYEEKPFRSLNLLLRVLDVADAPLEQKHLVLILQKLQHEAFFPLYHVYKKVGYIGSPTIEADINLLKTKGQVEEIKGSLKYSLTKKGKTEIENIPMPEEPLQTLKEIVNQIKDLPEQKTTELSSQMYLSHKLALEE